MDDAASNVAGWCRDKNPHGVSLRLVQCLGEIGDQVVGVFDADGVAYESLGNAKGASFFWRVFDMARRRGRADDGFDRAEVRRTMRPLEPWKKFADAIETTLDQKAQHAAESAHLACRDLVVRVRLEARVEHVRYPSVRRQKSCDGHSARVL